MSRELPPPGTHVTYRQQHSRCNRAGCTRCAPGSEGHGPYWYAYWQEGGRLRSRYLGKDRPEAAEGSISGQAHAGRPRSAHALAAANTPALRVRSLGVFAVWRGSKRIAAASWKHRKAAALFKALLSAPHYRLHREEAATLLWPDADRLHAGNNLRFALHQLRAVLDAPGAPHSYIQTIDGYLVVVASPDAEESGAEAGASPAWLDAAAFSIAAAEALAGDDIASCERALALYTGDYLMEERYEDWVQQRREELSRHHLAVLIHRARLASRPPRGENAVPAWRAVLQADPCQEEAAYALMRLAAESGQRSEALRIHSALTRALDEELGIGPSAAIERLRARLTAETASSGQAQQAQGLAEAPDGPAPAQHADTLPVALTSFVERPREQAAIGELLERARLLTLVGPGGAGKTRLALHIAAQRRDRFPDGVRCVELAALAEPGLVIEAVATVLGFVEIGPSRPRLAGLIDHLRTRQFLLVLDNCEHLLGACAELADTLLSASPGLRILATSRESIDIPGELVFRVPSLSVPDPDQLPASDGLLAYESVQLFVERARAHRASFTLTQANARAVSTICARLDGIPLAIELAAARVSALSVEGIADRLDDRFRLLTGGPRTVLPRQRTLRAALDWSHDLLGEAERILLRRLAVFAGGWTLDAAEAICAGEGVEDQEVLDLLSALVHKSLVITSEREDVARYALQETTRDYAHDRLAASGEALPIFERHATWYLALAERGATALLGPQQHAWVEQLATEHDNLRAALTWSGVVDAQSTTTPALRLRLAGALWRFWWMHGHLNEGRRWLEEALADGTGAPATLRARALDGAGALAADQGDYARARALHEESLGIWRGLGDIQGIASALNNLGSVAQQQGDHARARALHEESLGIWRGLGDIQGIASALNQLGCIARDELGDYARAATLLGESLALRRQLDDTRGIAIALNNLGLVALYQGDYARAEALLEEGLTLRQQLGDRRGIAISLGNIARVANRTGDHARGRNLFTESLSIRWELGDKRGVAECLEGLAAVAAAQGESERAARLLGAVDVLRRDIGSPWQPHDHLWRGYDTAQIREALGDVGFAAASRAGGTMSLKQVIAYATSAASAILAT